MQRRLCLVPVPHTLCPDPVPYLRAPDQPAAQVASNRRLAHHAFPRETTRVRVRVFSSTTPKLIPGIPLPIVPLVPFPLQALLFIVVRSG